MILVTGGTGLVGSHLLYQLSLENDAITAIHRKSSDLEAVKRVFGYYTDSPDELFAKITWKEADISDVFTLQSIFKDTFKHVYHCAAMVSFNPKDYYKLRNINIKGTANIVNLSIENKVEKFCFVSSVAAIDEKPQQQFVTEENDWNPELKHHGYAITKYGAEMEVWRGSQEGLNVVIVNPGVILGAGFFNSGSGKIISTVANGFKFYTEGITGFIGVEDVVKCMVLLMKSSVTNERFILVSENVSFKTVFHQIADELGVKKPSTKVTKFISEVAWRLAWLQSSLTGKEPLITKHSARSGHHTTLYTSDKVKNTLNFEFEPLKKTIKSVCKQYK